MCVYIYIYMYTYIYIYIYIHTYEKACPISITILGGTACLIRPHLCSTALLVSYG